MKENDVQQMQFLMTNGMLIFPGNGKFVLKKMAVPANPVDKPDQEFATYEEAYAAALEMLQDTTGPQLHEFTAIVRYNRGLGIEYKNLPDIQALNMDEAQELAREQAEIILDGGKVDIREIRVRPKI